MGCMLVLFSRATVVSVLLCFSVATIICAEVAQGSGELEKALKTLELAKVIKPKINNSTINSIYNLDYRASQGNEGQMYKGIALELVDTKLQNKKINKIKGILIESKNECQWIPSERMKDNLPEDGIVLGQGGGIQIYIEIYGWLSHHAVKNRRIMLVCYIDAELTLLYQERPEQ